MGLAERGAMSKKAIIPRRERSSKMSHAKCRDSLSVSGASQPPDVLAMALLQFCNVAEHLAEIGLDDDSVCDDCRSTQ